MSVFISYCLCPRHAKEGWLSEKMINMPYHHFIMCLLVRLCNVFGSLLRKIQKFRETFPSTQENRAVLSEIHCSTDLSSQKNLNHGRLRPQKQGISLYHILWVFLIRVSKSQDWYFCCSGDWHRLIFSNNVSLIGVLN